MNRACSRIGRGECNQLDWRFALGRDATVVQDPDSVTSEVTTAGE